MTHKADTVTYSRKGLSTRAAVALIVLSALLVATAAAALWLYFQPSAPAHTFFQGATETMNTVRLLSTCR